MKIKLSEKLKQYFMNYGLDMTLSDESELYNSLVKLEGQIESIQNCFIEISNCGYYSDSDANEIDGYYVPLCLIKKLDKEVNK